MLFISSCADTATYYSCMTKGEKNPLAFYFTPPDNFQAFVGVNFRRYYDRSSIPKFDFSKKYVGTQTLLKRTEDKISLSYAQQTVKGFFLKEGEIWFVWNEKEKKFVPSEEPYWERGDISSQEEVYMTFHRVYEHEFNLKNKSLKLVSRVAEEDLSFEVLRQKVKWRGQTRLPSEKQELSSSLESKAKKTLIDLYPPKIWDFTCREMTSSEVFKLTVSKGLHLFTFP